MEDTLDKTVLQNDVTAFKKAAVEKAKPACEFFDLTDAAKPLLEDDPSSTTFFNRLMDNKLYMDAIRFLALVLRKREAVWWACLCVRDVMTDKVTHEDKRALLAAEEWVIKPTEENRQLASQAAEATKFETAAGWAAMGAFWSGGSMTPPGTPVVPPQEDFTGRAVGGSVLMSAAYQFEDEKQLNERYELFLERAKEIANGGSGKLKDSK